MLLGGQTTEFHMYDYLPFLPIAHWFQLSDRSLISQATPSADVACDTIIICLEERKVVGRKTWKSFFALFVAISQVSTCHLSVCGHCVGVRRAMALIGGAKQAMGEGKNGPVETGLTGPAATALRIHTHST